MATTWNGSLLVLVLKCCQLLIRLTCVLNIMMLSLLNNESLLGKHIQTDRCKIINFKIYLYRNLYVHNVLPGYYTRVTGILHTELQSIMNVNAATVI